MKTEALKLGQAGDWKSEGVWFFITFRDGRYLVWSEAEDGEFREMFEVDPKAPLPMIKVRRFQTAARDAFVRKASRKYARFGKIPQEAVEKIIRDSVAREVLEDWQNIAQKDGTVAEYSPEAGNRAFMDDPTFYEAVVAVAHDEDYHRAASLKEDAEALGEA